MTAYQIEIEWLLIQSERLYSPQGARVREDALYKDVLKAIQAGAENPQALAAEVLKGSA